MNKTKWISNKDSRTNSNVIDGSLLLRKNFTTKKGVKSATVEVSGLGIRLSKYCL